MKLPAVWMACAFAGGIALADRWPGSGREWTLAAIAAILAGVILLWRGWLAAAWTVALAAWLALGGAALNMARVSVPANHVSRLIAAGRLDGSQPLRWRGTLRDDPVELPWGRRFVIALDHVEIAGQEVPVTGGLRVNLYSDERGASGADDPPSAPGPLAGDRVEALLKARPPRTFLDPGAFDLHAYLALQGVNLTGSLRDEELLRVTARPIPTLRQRLARARGALFARLDSLFRGDAQRGAVLRAMLLGDRSFVDSRVVTAFQKTAAYHVLVVAGLHVGALAIFFFWLGRRFRLSVALTSVLTLAALAAYAGIVQDRPPILRAALMVALYLCARPLFRRVELLNTVALAALALLVWKPQFLTDSSFELSFLAAGVIAGLAMPWIERTSAPYRSGLAHLGDVTRDAAHPPRVVQFRIEMRGASQWLAARLPHRLGARAGSLLALPIRFGFRLWEIVVLSAVIQWGMMPLLAGDFHRVSLTGPLSNIPAVILTGVIVPLGFLALAATFVWMRLALVLAKVLGFLAGLLLASVEWFSRWPRVSYRIPGPPAPLMILFFAALVCLAAVARAAAARGRDRNARRGLPPRAHPAEWAAAGALAALTILVAWHPFPPNLVRGQLAVNVLDVGQGDSIFVAFPKGRTMLVDGGGLAGSEWTGGYRSGVDVGEEVVSPYLWSRGLKSLDVVALTHAHHDHIDGLFSVLDNFRVGELWIGRDEDTAAFRALLAEARSRGVRIVRKTQGGEFDWDGVHGDVLWPPQESAVNEASNDDSLVMRLKDSSVSFLLPGDAQERVEDRLVKEHAPLAADFLKVPHHGSKTSSTALFLAAVHPRIAAVSVGEGNPFGHPAEEIVERYAGDGIHLLRTDRDGAVTASTDGRSLTVRSFVEEQAHTYAQSAAVVREPVR